MQRVNTAALVEGLKLEVSSNFPFLEGETFEEWISRANQLLNPSQRAMLAASIGTVQRKLVAERSAQKRAWIAAARLEFQPGRRQACFVCGGFEPIAQAHHVVPLNEQFEHGFDKPDHEYEWLCPNHHVILHLCIDRSASTQSLGRRIAPSMADIPLEHFDKLMELVGRAGRTTHRPRSSPQLAASWSAAFARSSARTS